MNEERFQSAGGINLFARSWPAAGKTRGVVLIVPGFNSHSGYYIWAAEQFAAHGLAAYAIDLRGRGKSDGDRFYVEKFSDYVSDVAALMKLVKTRQPRLPVILLGHSAGGVVSCMYSLEHQNELAGFVCEDFAFQVPAPDVAIAVLRGVSHLAPHVHVLKLKNEDFSRNPKVVQMMNDDPLIANESQPSLTIAEIARADELLKQSFPKIKLPLFILHGTADKVTKPSGSQLFYDTAGSTDKTLKFYEGYFHDPLNDVGKEVVMADIQAWIDKRVAA